MLTAAELAAIWGDEAEPQPVREEITVPLNEIKPGDFLRQTVQVSARGPKDGRYRVRALRFNLTVAEILPGVLSPLTITFTNGSSVYFPCPTQPAKISREKE